MSAEVGVVQQHMIVEWTVAEEESRRAVHRGTQDSRSPAAVNNHMVVLAAETVVQVWVRPPAAQKGLQFRVAAVPQLVVQPAQARSQAQEQYTQVLVVGVQLWTMQRECC